MSAKSPPVQNESSPIHIVVTRRVRPGCEAQFQQALREFFQASFGHYGVLGVSMLVPPPGSGSREFGILRTFASEQDRDAFYASELFRDWLKRVEPLAEDNWTYRHLNGMEAWFRSPQNPPPRWKMALVTFVAVWPVSLLLRALLAPLIGDVMPAWLYIGVISAGIVAVLTWGLMPLLTLAVQAWLQPPRHPALGEERRFPGAQDF